LNRLFVPTTSLGEWRRLLASPSRQWRARKSAYELAVAWEAARTQPRGLPLDVADLLDKQTEFIGAELLIGIPEHHVRIVGGGHASQTDLWALMRAPIGLVSVAVEAKAGESFDDAFPDWLHGAPTTSGKPARLAELQRILNLTEEQAHRCRYQLLHRAAAAIIEATGSRSATPSFWFSPLRRVQPARSTTSALANSWARN
jgi:hypothetical protein